MKKNLLKNVLAVSVVAAMAISFAACSETTETSAETEAEETVVETTVEETVAETTVEETVVETVVETEAEETVVVELDGEIDEDLLGSWTLEQDGAVIVYTFNDDNTGVCEMTYGEESVEIAMQYSADGETLTVVMTDFGTETDVAEYTVDGDTLTLVTEGETMELTREA